MTEQSQPMGQGRTWLLLGVVVIVIVVALRDSYFGMLRMWLELDNFKHCLLIAPVSAWLIWSRRDKLAKLTPKLSWLGLALFLGTLIDWFVGVAANISIIENFAAVSLLPLAAWALLGTRVAREIMFPLGYLLFMVPFGSFLIPPLMDFTADMTVAAVRLSGIAVYHDGLYFSIPQGSFRVIEACSGVRMLLAGIAVGALISYLNFNSLARRLLFIGFVVLLALVANWIRAYIVVVTAHFLGIEQVADHVWVGYLVFIFVLVIMIWCGERFGDLEQEGAPAEAPATPGSSASAVASIGAVMLVTLFLAPRFTEAVVTRAEESIAKPVMSLPTELAGWTGPGAVPFNWVPQFTGDTITASGRYRIDDAPVDIYVISYRSQSKDSELINEANRVYDPELWVLIETVARADSVATGLRYLETELSGQPGENRLIRHWYIVDGQPTLGRVSIKFTELMNTLAGRGTPAGVVAISAPFTVDSDAARLRLDAFMRAAMQ